MDESVGTKFPEGEPSGQWTVEQLVNWSLHQYQQHTVHTAEQHVESLRLQCDNDCDNANSLLEMARDATAAETTGPTTGKDDKHIDADAENVDPQTAGNATNAANATNADSVKSPTKTNNDAANKSKIEILVTSGPHASAKFLLRPKSDTPCYVGRSKGKKFVKNGISLGKDAEISTTHGKFLVEAGLGNLGPTFYFVDVGSTNGTFLEGEQLEPEKLVRLTEGMELRLGSSNLKIMLS